MNECNSVLEIKLKKLAGRSEMLTGATLGNRHREQVVSKVAIDVALWKQLVVLLNFDGVQFASASYLKAAVIGLAQTETTKEGDATAIFPVISNVAEPIFQELKIVCKSERFPCLEANSVSSGSVVRGTLYGELDRNLVKSLQTLQKLGRGTASDVAGTWPDEGINITAWNNRLAELFRLRLAMRMKEGKFWQYQPISRKINYGMEN